MRSAAEHAAGKVSLLLELTLSNGWLRVALADGLGVASDRAGDEHRGQHVPGDRLARQWGVEDYHGGKRVWFELMPRT